MCRCLLLLVAAVALAAGVAHADGSTRRSASAPEWTNAKRVCPDVRLTDAEHPSGVSGPHAGGYNAFVLRIVAKRGVGCPTARRLARDHWTDGARSGLAWRQRRAWRSTVGSGWIGHFAGTSATRRVDYHAVH